MNYSNLKYLNKEKTLISSSITYGTPSDPDYKVVDNVSIPCDPLNTDYATIIRNKLQIVEWSESQLPDITLESVRNYRDILLKNSDFSQLPDVQLILDSSQKMAWLTYRQNLRDFTNGLNLTGVKSIEDLKFPVKPL